MIRPRPHDWLAAAPPGEAPPLEAGDHLSREEFRRRYEAMPHVKKAELIQGAVYMPSPVRLPHHGQPHLDLAAWLGSYRFATPGVFGGDNTTLRLDGANEPQPDLMLLIDPARGGQARIGADGYVESAPELVAEVAASSVSHDLHDKLESYRRNAVAEYIVWRVLDQQIDWFVLREQQYERLLAGDDGVLRSTVFPGLWLDAPALVRGDHARLVEALRQGTASPEHAAFVQRLKAPAAPPP